MKNKTKLEQTKCYDYQLVEIISTLWASNKTVFDVKKIDSDIYLVRFTQNN